MTLPDKPLSRNVARAVSALRRERGLTCIDLAKRVAHLGQPIARLGLARIERGERRVDVDELAALADALGVPFGRLLADTAACERCNDAPPLGFTCRTCGAEGPA